MSLYPEISPFQTGYLDTGEGHEIYWETSGNPSGIPMVFLHGGPGSGSSPWQRRLFNPGKFLIILFDQRGAGKSRPHAGLHNNTTAHLIEDMELLRRHLKIGRWHVSGGSWGSTLALAYADRHPDKTSSLTIYGLFLCRDHELRDMYFEDGAASRFFPDAYEDFFALLSDTGRKDPIRGYRELFDNPDKNTRYKAVVQWTRLEKQLSALIVSEQQLHAEMENPDFVLAHSLLENHYFLHNGFIDGDALLKSLPHKLAKVPVNIVQGRYDMVCPIRTAWELHQALPESKLHIMEAAGHTAKETSTTECLVKIFDALS